MKWYLQAVRNYFDFSGRARRKEYWYFSLFYFIFAIVIAFICEALRSMLLYYAYILFSIIPALAVAIRRMHDVNKSGWFILIPIYNLVLYCTDGTQGPNRFGSDPKRPEFEEFLNESETAQPL
jgi:uncharacterized membrane protein YhaH (DUF805 family)